MTERADGRRWPRRSSKRIYSAPTGAELRGLLTLGDLSGEEAGDLLNVKGRQIRRWKGEDARMPFTALVALVVLRFGRVLNDRGNWRGEIRDLLEGDSGNLYLVLDSQETLCPGPPWAPLWGRADIAEVQRRRRVLDGHPGAWVQVWGQGSGDA